MAPASTKYLRHKSSIPPVHKMTLAPEARIFCIRSLVMSDSLRREREGGRERGEGEGEGEGKEGRGRGRGRERGRGRRRGRGKGRGREMEGWRDGEVSV